VCIVVYDLNYYPAEMLSTFRMISVSLCWLLCAIQESPILVWQNTSY